MRIAYLFLRHTDGQAKFRAIITVIAVMIATAMLAAILALGQGWALRMQKDNLLSAFFPSGTSTGIEAGGNDAVYTVSYDTKFGSKTIKELGIYSPNLNADLPVGLSQPKENELLVTPALKRLIDSNSLLRQRYDKYVIKEAFPRDLAPSPDSLLLLYRIPDSVMTSSAAQLHKTSVGNFQKIYHEQNIASTSQARTIRLVLLLVGIILIFPVLILVVEAARIGIAQRERRYAALSLAGATNGQMRSVVLTETFLLSLAGVLCGILLFIPVWWWVLPGITFGSSHLWSSDMALSKGVFAVICGVVMFCTVATNMQIFRGIKILPLNVSRAKNVIKRPHILTLLPLILGCGATYLLYRFGEDWYNANLEAGGLLLALLLLVILIGLFMSGPYVTYLVSNILIKLFRKASGVIAAYRLRAFPQRIFHSVSGVVIALFVGTLLMTFVQTMEAAYSETARNLSSDILAEQNKLQLPRQITITLPQEDSQKAGAPLINALAQEQRLEDLTAQRYVQRGFIENRNSENELSFLLSGDYYESCQQLEQRTQLRCDDQQIQGPVVASFGFIGDKRPVVNGDPRLGVSVTPVNDATGNRYNKSYILVGKNDATFKRLSIMVQNFIAHYQRDTGVAVPVDYQAGESSADEALAFIEGIKNSVVIIMALTIIIAGISLLVSTTGGIFDRKDAFISLRMMGAGMGTLRKSVLIEAAVPIFTVSIVAVGLGVLFCHWTLSITGFYDNGSSLSLPDASFWAYLFMAIGVCLLITFFNTPLLARITDPSKAQRE